MKLEIRWPFQRVPEVKSTIQDIDISAEEDKVTSILLGLSSDDSAINIQPYTAYTLAERSSDLGSAITRICKAISAFIPVIMDNDGEVRYDDPILDPLNNPGEMRSRAKFLYEITESYLLTNESWIVARGNVNREPLAIIPIRPYDVTVIMDDSDGMPKTIITGAECDRRTYERDTKGGQFRFIDKPGLNEIIPIIGQSNLTDGWRGRSPLNKLYYDVTMNSAGKRHNKSMLENGMRPSAVLSPKGTGNAQGAPQEWKEKAVSELQKGIRAFHQGAGNAGNVLILGKPAELQNMMNTNVEMDYSELMKASKESIYNLYQIPLPLILSDAMTLSNYSIALRSFYVDAVFPVYDYIMSGFLDGLKNRYKSISDGEMIGFSEIDIRGMRPVLVENMKALKDTEVVTVNEIRNTGGFDDEKNGNVILVTSSKATLESVAGGGNFNDTENTEIVNNLPEEDDETDNDNLDLIQEESLKKKK